MLNSSWFNLTPHAIEIFWWSVRL
uniref:Uncharacterized protein n=1 Tax=Anguilla anguilla TaxID=7936 RepID=A0A0E9VI62_ANGAN